MESENTIPPGNDFPEDPSQKQKENVIPEFPDKRINNSFKDTVALFLISGITIVNLILFIFTAVKKFT
ncbi:MAG: hypothetical protein IPM96_17265 [Ignavibacteria bacterium]|nr:hypothetical protein [Ignavibacteria bacterium]